MAPSFFEQTGISATFSSRISGPISRRRISAPLQLPITPRPKEFQPLQCSSLSPGCVTPSTCRPHHAAVLKIGPGKRRVEEDDVVLAAVPSASPSDGRTARMGELEQSPRRACLSWRRGIVQPGRLHMSPIRAPTAFEKKIEVKAPPPGSWRALTDYRESGKVPGEDWRGRSFPAKPPGKNHIPRIRARDHGGRVQKMVPERQFSFHVAPVRGGFRRWTTRRRRRRWSSSSSKRRRRERAGRHGVRLRLDSRRRGATRRSG